MKTLHLISKNIPDYELLDSGEGKKLELISNMLVVRPCPQAIWKPHLTEKEWSKATSICHRTKDGGGKWEFKKGDPGKFKFKWSIDDKDLNFSMKFTPFGHCGIFFEQFPVWEELYWATKKIASEKGPKEKVKVVNLFGYTGAASIVMALAGAEVFHIDSAKGVLTWGKESLTMNPAIAADKIKWVQEDAVKFLKHSAKKEFLYDGILADPPSWGHGANSEVWTFEDQISEFSDLCFKTLHKKGFFLLSTHTHGVQHEALRNILNKKSQEAIAGEISVAHKNDSRLLPAGIFGLLCF